MFKTEIKDNLFTIWSKGKGINEELIEMKVALHTLEKLGCNVESLYKQLENVGIEFYKLKTEIDKSIKELI